MTGLYEIDLLGKIYNEYSIKGGYHHDYFELPSGNLLVASDDFYNESGTVEDYVVELDRNTGKIVKTFDLKDILKMEDGKSENWTSYDWFHNNSIWYDEKTNSITLSGRHQDAVINISYETKDVAISHLEKIISPSKLYVVGDSDVTDEFKSVKCDVIFVPVGGVYTMSDSEAALSVNEMNVKVAVPVHYGEVGSRSNAENFVNMLNENIEGIILK